MAFIQIKIAAKNLDFIGSNELKSKCQRFSLPIVDISKEGK
jgi:hypothetical protein